MTKRKYLLQTEDGTILFSPVFRAETFWSRLTGMMFRTPRTAWGLFLAPCSSVHTMWMRFSLDLLFIDRDGRVLRFVSSLSPWRGAFCRGARAVIELPAGSIVGLRSGASIRLVPLPDQM